MAPPRWSTKLSLLVLRGLRALTVLLLLSTGPAAGSEPPVTSPALPTDAELYGQLFGAAISAQVHGPALVERVKAMSDAELVAALAAIQTQRPEAAGQPPTPDPSAATALLDRVLANPDALAVLEWLPPAEHATASAYFEDWQAALKLRGRGDAARLEVEPIDGVFNRTIPAAGLADYRVVAKGAFGEKTLLAPPDRGEACCQVLDWMLLDEVPMAYGSLRLYLEAAWVSAKVRQGLEVSASRPE